MIPVLHHHLRRSRVRILRERVRAGLLLEYLGQVGRVEVELLLLLLGDQTQASRIKKRVRSLLLPYGTGRSVIVDASDGPLFFGF